MKKFIIYLLTISLAFAFAACGTGGNQEINFQGFKMEIPSSWKAEMHTMSDDYAEYEQLNKTGHDYRILLSKTFGLLPKCEGGMKEAGAFFKEVTEDDASYSNVSDPVEGKFAGKYNMHTIECEYHALNLMENDKESDYPCKLIRIYMDDHDVEIEFITQKGDFEAFDKAIKNAVCE